MKFNKAEKIKIRIFKKKPLPKKDVTINNIQNFHIYNNLSIFLMKPETKGNFKDISLLASDGKYPTSWTIRLSITKGCWQLYFGPHPQAEKPDINIRQLFEDNFSGVDISGYLYVCIVKSIDKNKMEEIIEFLIKNFNNNKLVIKDYIININYIKANTVEKYKIHYNVKEVKQYDKETYKKYLLLIEHIMNHKNISKEEQEIVKQISKFLFKNKILTERHTSVLNKYTNKYVSQRDKIKIAITYLQRGK